MTIIAKPAVRPNNPRFSCGPCTKHPGWSLDRLGGALLGSVYAIAEDNRDGAVRDFVGGFLAATGRRRTRAATTIRQVFAALVPDAPGAAQVRPGLQSPAWTGQLGRVRLTGSLRVAGHDRQRVTPVELSPVVGDAPA